MKRILMTERSDIYHDGRVLKEASSLYNVGYHVKIFGLRDEKTNKDWKFDFEVKTKYVIPRKFGLLRKLHIVFLVVLFNFRILFTKADYYHAHNTMFLIGCWLAKIIYDGILIYDSHEVQWELNKVAKVLENLFIRKVDIIINVSEGRAKEQAVRYGLNEKEIIIISNYPVKNKNKKAEINKVHDGKINFIFSGGLNLYDNKIDNFVRAMVDFPQIELNLLVFSYGDSIVKLKKIINELDLAKRINFVPLVPPEDVVKTIAQYDLTVNLITNPKNLVSINYHSINKIYEALAAGLPILCSDLPAFNSEIVENNAGISVNPYDVDSIINGLSRLINDSNYITKMKKNAIDLSVNRFNWASQEKKLIGLYKSLSK